MATVLVTGGSGFIGSHAIARLLGDGHAVHATVRRLDRADGVRALLRQAGVDADDAQRQFERFGGFYQADAIHHQPHFAGEKA